MVLFDCLHGSEFVRSFSKRIQVVSDRFERSPFAARLKRGRKRLLGAALLLLSIVMGVWAHDLAQAEALGGWLRGHPPSNAAWKHSLESRGYHALTDAKALQKASRTLPSLVDEESSVWGASDAGWIAVYHQQEDGMTSSIFCLECKKPPAGWQPLGQGWAAFDPTLALADAAVKRFAPALKAKRAAPIDPLELRY
jgi:hypothetical protein